MSQPLSRFNACIWIANRLAIDFYLHFIDFDARYGVVRNVEVTVKRRQLFELHFIDDCSLFVRERQLKRPILLSSEVFYLPLHSSFRQVEISDIVIFRQLAFVDILCRFYIRRSIARNRPNRVYVLPVLYVLSLRHRRQVFLVNKNFSYVVRHSKFNDQFFNPERARQPATCF